MKISEEEFLNQLENITETKLLSLDLKLNNNSLFDSLSLMTIAAWISDNFNINIKVADLEKMNDLNELYILIKD